MNEFERWRGIAEINKRNYPKGTRLLLEAMGNDPRPIESGTRATVQHVDDMGTIHCLFDNGRRLGLITGEDSFRKLTAEELNEELESESQTEDSGMQMGGM